MVYYGYGWQIAQDEDGSTRWIGHGGTINGAYASLRYYPRYDMVVAGIANYDWLMTNERAAFFEFFRLGRLVVAGLPEAPLAIAASV